MKDFHHAIDRNNRRAREKGLEGNLTFEEWEHIADIFKDEYDNLICPYCNKKGADSLDHIVPLSNRTKGTTKNNIIPSHKTCNEEKSSQEVHIYEHICKTNKINCLKIEMIINNMPTGGYTYLEFKKEDWELFR